MARRKNRKNYDNKWVATVSFKNKKIVASGKSVEKVVKKARRKGVKDPVVFFVSKHPLILPRHL